MALLNVGILQRHLQVSYPEDCGMNLHHRENPKSRMVTKYSKGPEFDLNRHQ
jgi:hypothetical protein